MAGRRNIQLPYRKYHKKTIKYTSATTILPCPDVPISYITILERVRLLPKHTNSIRRTVKRLIKKSGRLERLLPTMWPVTSKPIQIRMGKGKGAVDYWTSRVEAGSTVASVRRLSYKVAQQVMLTTSTKLPGRTYVVTEVVKRWDINP